MTIHHTHASSVSREYALMVSALAEAAKRRDGELATAELAYQDSAAAASGELARAEGEAAAADRWAGTAAAAVLDVDREAARLWDQLRRSGGWRALGELPEPGNVDALTRAAIAGPPDAATKRPGPAREVLDRAASRIEQSTTRRVVRRPLPRWALPALPLVGAVLAAMTGLIAGGLVTLGDGPSGPQTVLRVLGWLAFLVAPSTGVPVVAYLAHWRLQARLDVGGVGLTLLGGMLAATTLSLSFFW